jgi:hypothetical protein
LAIGWKNLAFEGFGVDRAALGNASGGSGPGLVEHNSILSAANGKTDGCLCDR